VDSFFESICGVEGPPTCGLHPMPGKEFFGTEIVGLARQLNRPSPSCAGRGRKVGCAAGIAADSGALRMRGAVAKQPHHSAQDDSALLATTSPARHALP